MKRVRFKLFQEILNDEVDLGEHDLWCTFWQGEVGNVFSKFRGSHMAHYDRAEGTDFLIGPDEAGLMHSFIRRLLEAEDLAGDRCDVEVKEGGQVYMFQDAVTGNELGSFRSACLIRDDILHQFFNLEVIVPIVVGNLSENHLPVVVA